jgi:hypothetical protein
MQGELAQVENAVELDQQTKHSKADKEEKERSE